MGKPLLLIAFAAISLQAADTRQILDEIFAVHQFREVTITRDGRFAAWVESHGGKNPAEARNSNISLKDLRGAGGPKQLTGDRCQEHSPAWSRDGRLAYLSDAGSKGQLQLWVAAHPGEGPAKKLTSFKGFLQDPQWSPDGRTIALLLTENAPRAAGPLEATTPDVGVVDQTIYEQRLALIDAKTGSVRTISPADLYVYEYDWSPNSNELVYTAAPGPGDDNWFIAQLYKIDVADGKATKLYKPALQIAEPRWSPDGKSIAFIEGLMSDEGSTGGEIYVIPSAGGSAKDVTPGRKSTPSWFQFLPSSSRLLMAEHVAGQTAFSTLDLATGQSERLWIGPESVMGAFTPDAAMSAVIRSSWSLAPEVWAGPVGGWKQITTSNDGAKVRWGKAESVAWKDDKFDVQGWLLLPVNYDANKQYPMVVSPHGGPAAESRPHWPGAFFDLSILSSQGFFVFLPNARGSYGQGEAFTRANVKDFGGGDLRDILSGVDTVLKRYPVDSNRIGIGGWSYGGFMTMWAVTQTNRFHAAVAGAGLANWQSYYGENSIDEWMIPYFGASVYDDPQVYAKSSPINFIKHVKTPTLVVVGERDGECPAPQSYEFWHALKTLGVKTEFVIYPNEGHHFRNPEHVQDLMDRTIAWFTNNLR